MKITVEGSGLEIGTNDSITKSMLTGNWGIRISILNDNNTSRYEFVLKESQANDFISDIQGCIEKIQTIKNNKR